MFKRFRKQISPLIRLTKQRNLKRGVVSICLVCLLGNIQLQAQLANTHDVRMTARFNSMSLVDALRKVTSETGAKILYSTEDLEGFSVSANIQNRTALEVINILLKNKPFTIVVKGDFITITRIKTKINEQRDGYRLIKGRVVDEDNEPLIGVSVVGKNSPFGVSTEADGTYELRSGTNSVTLVYTFLGMKNTEIIVQAGDEDQNLKTVVMKADGTQLNTVVVTGYQTFNKTRIAGAVSTISTDDLYLNGVNSIEQALQGTMPGVVVTNTSGLVGVRQQTRVRGTSTLTGSADPVWVVDDVIQEDPLPFNTQTFNGLGEITADNFDYIKNFVGNSVSWLNPNDIESITVLKDASATAIYGVRAANGVIVIKTKRGKIGKPVVSYTGSFNIGERVSYDNLGMMNSKERVAVSREIFNRGLIASWTNNNIGYAGAVNEYLNKNITYDELQSQVAKLETQNTDWFKILFRNPVSYSHSLNISGGTEAVRYTGSFGYSSNNGTAIGNESDTYNARIGLNMQASKKLNIDFNITISDNSTDGFYNVSPYNYALKTNRAISAYNDNGELDYYQRSNGYLFNVVNERDQSKTSNKQTSINSGLNINYHFNDNLKFQSLLNMKVVSTHGYSYATEKTNYIAAIRYFDYGTANPTDDTYKNSPLPRGGEYNSDDARSHTWSWRNTMSYDKLFNNVHAFTALIGVDLSSVKYDGFSSTQYGYLRDRGESFATVPVTYGATSTYYNTLYTTKFSRGITNRLTNNMGTYLTLNYAYDNRYVVNFSVRGDASNRFGKNTNENFNPVWAGGLRWNATHEKWFKPNKYVSDFSLRASFGYQRNMASNYSSDLIVKIPTGTTSDVTDVNTGEDLLTISNLPYRDLRWEKTLSTNLGIDLAMFDNRLRLSSDFYWKRGRDMIVTYEVPVEYGVESMPINGGSLDNTGIEINLGITPIRSKNITWDFNVNAAKNTNKIIKSSVKNPTWRTAVGGNLQKEGYPVNSFWAFDFSGIDQSNGYPIIDLTLKENSDPLNDPTSYMKYVGSLDPDFTGGLGTSFRYKQFTVSTTMAFQVGGKKFLSPAYQSTTLPSEYENLPNELNARWRPGDTNAKFPGLPDATANKNYFLLPDGKTYSNVYEMYNYSTERVVSASTLRVNSISLGYTLPSNLVQKIDCQDVTIRGSVSQPFSIVSKDFKGRDAEVSTDQQPRTRSYSLNLYVTF